MPLPIRERSVLPGTSPLILAARSLCVTLLPQAYVSQLAQVQDEVLEKAGVKVLVIGCGNYQPIKQYQRAFAFIENLKPLCSGFSPYLAQRTQDILGQYTLTLHGHSSSTLI